MLICVISIKIRIYSVYSLKDKRNILASIITKIQNKFKVSIAEVGENDIMNIAFIGIAIVGNDARHLMSVSDKIIRFLDQFDDVELLKVDREIN